MRSRVRTHRPALKPHIKSVICSFVVAAVLTAPSGTSAALTTARRAPQSSACAGSVLPPPAVDTSEVPPPGQASPPPLPVPNPAVGGSQLGSCRVILPPHAPPPPPQITAATWVVADLDTGEVLAGKDPHGRQRPASTIKVLTGLLAVRELEMDDTIVATQADADQEGSKVGLAPGVPYKVRDVLTGLLLQSGNDAAHALARKLGGIPATVTKMNELAERLHARDTRVATPSGLDGPGMSTSAYDLALLFQAGMRDPDFARAVGTRRAQLPGPPGQPPLTVSNDNTVVREYPGGLGGKTGFTDDARHTFIGAAERGGRRLVAVLLRGENKPLKLSRQTMGLLDYGFALGQAPPVGTLARESQVRQERAAAKTAPETGAKKPRAAGTSAETTRFGALDWSIGLLGVASAAVLGAVVVRQRRIRKAVAARSEESDAPEEHPKA